ncbi:MAG TPA: chemotaxis protein CheB, partial [Azospirillaceae bacterium]|nr:chemotaxis protein CheB [Azospirillaceae bacterium]
VILRGGGDTQVRRRPDSRFVLKAFFDSQEIYHPSANLLLRSAAAEAHAPVAVILTGMGNDGTAGARDFAARNLPVLVQEPGTCAVDGMPCSAIREGLATAVLPAAALGRKLNTWLNP